MRVGCLYVKHFPAWAFVRSGRERRPVVVIAREHVVACSPLARAKGIMEAMPLQRVRALLPEACLCHRDPHLESAAWEQVLHALNTLTPFIEDHGPGRAFLAAFEEEVLRQLAAGLGAQVGIAPSRSLALLGALRAAPGTACDVTTVDSFLVRCRVELLAEIGYAADLIAQLWLFGYFSLSAVSTLSRRHLGVQFGPEGERLHTLLHPEHEPPVARFQPPPVIRRAFDFEHPATEPGELLPVLEHLVHRAAESLASSLLCRRVAVHLCLHRQAQARLACRILPEATREPGRLLGTAKTLLFDLVDDALEIDAMILELGALHAGTPEQGSLFFSRPSLYAAVRAVHRCYPGALLRAVPVPHALLHEQEVRFEPFPEVEPKRNGSGKRSQGRP